MTDILLITEQSIKNLTNISDNMSGKLLLPAIRESQEINLREILGDALLNELKRQVEIDDVRETYGRLLLQCQYYLAYQSCANICMITSVKIDNAGLQRVSDEKMEPLPVSEVNQIHDYYQQKADFYCERLQHFLLQNKDDYPQLNTRQCNAINSNLYSSASCGIFLGGPRSKNVDKGYGDGLNSSKSQGVEKLDVELTENGTYDYKPKGYGYNEVHIDVNTPELHNQEKSITISENGQTSVVPDEEYTGLNKVSVNVDVHPTERLERTYTENGVYEIDGEYNGGEISVDVGDVTQYMNMKPYADETGLVELGWDEDSINNFKYNHYIYDWQKKSLTDEEIQFCLNSCLSADSWESNKSQITYLPKGQAYAPTNFSYCKKLKGIPLIDTSSITDFGGMFCACDELTTVPLFDTSNGTSFGSNGTFSNAGMFNRCDKLQSLPLFDTSNGTIFGCMLQSNKKLTTIPLFDTSKGVDFHYMFAYCSSLTSIPALDVSNGTNFSSMFYDCGELITVPELNTSKGTDFSWMFYECNKLKTVPELNTSNGTDFHDMFGYCSSLTSIPALDVSKGTNFSSMFYACEKLITVPELNTSNGTDFEGMFYRCSSLTSIPALDVSKGTNFSSMFYKCSYLTSIPALDVSNGTDFEGMFYICKSLTDITFTGSINIDIPFNYCAKLTFDSIKSILTACSKTTNTNSKKVRFDRTIQDQNNELTNLVAQCTEKGWTVSGLTITQ